MNVRGFYSSRVDFLILNLLQKSNSLKKQLKIENARVCGR